MSLSELPGAAPGECALSISVSELAKHPLRGLPADPSQTHRQACPVLDHCLDAPIARPASGHLGVDRRTAFDLTAVELTSKIFHSGVDDHGGTVRVRIFGDLRRAHGHQGIGPSGLHGPLAILTRHDRELVGQTLQGVCDHRPFSRGKLCG